METKTQQWDWIYFQAKNTDIELPHYYAITDPEDRQGFVATYGRITETSHCVIRKSDLILNIFVEKMDKICIKNEWLEPAHKSNEAEFLSIQQEAMRFVRDIPGEE